MVFQSYAIWPHMTVFENVAYGLRVRRTEAAEIAEKVHQRARHGADAQLRDRGGRRSCPADSSSGLRWRAPSCSQPSVLLFDEPLSNLDAKLRADMRIELRELQHRLGITSVYVTHDLEEALAMSDRIVVMRDGLIEQTGTPDEIYRLPRNAFVADFVGSANLIRGRHRADLDADGLIALETSARTHRLRHGLWTARWRRAGGLGAHRASADFDGAAGRDAKRLAGAGRADGVSGRFHAGSRRLGRATSGRPLRGDGAAGGGAGCLHQRRAASCRGPGCIADSSAVRLQSHDRK